MDSVPQTNRKSLSIIFLIIASLLFGSTLIITKLSTQTVSIFTFGGLRYFIGFLVYIPLLKQLRKLKKSILLVSILTGIANYLLLSLQTIGLQYTTAAKGGFITSLYIVITPIIARLLIKTPLKKKFVISVVLALIGMLLLIFDNPLQIWDPENPTLVNIGDVFVFLAAISISFQFFLTEYYFKKYQITEVILFSMLQIFTVSMLSFATALFIGENFNQIISFDSSIWIVLLYMGIIATTIPLFLQNWAQKHISSSQTALIFSLIPIFSAFFGFLIGDEVITLSLIIGGSLIIAAILVSSKS
jgi:drug/metabolite transporter (DMT)-like permease